MCVCACVPVCVYFISRPTHRDHFSCLAIHPCLPLHHVFNVFSCLTVTQGWFLDSVHSSVCPPVCLSCLYRGMSPLSPFVYPCIFPIHSFAHHCHIGMFSLVSANLSVRHAFSMLPAYADCHKDMVSAPFVCLCICYPSVCPSHFYLLTFLSSIHINTKL